MGPHFHLRKFQLTLDLTTGVPKVVFTCIRESVINAEIEAEESVEDELNESAITDNSELRVSNIS